MTLLHAKQKSFSWFRVITATTMILTGLVAAAAAGLWIYEFIAEPPSFSRLTSGLPAGNRIEVEAVQGSETDISEVQSSRILIATEANDFETLWRSQPFRDGPGDLCHSPIYRVRFYKNDALFAEATICFECNNIHFVDHPTVSSTRVFREISFNAATVESKRLRSYLSEMFPGHDPGAHSKQTSN